MFKLKKYGYLLLLIIVFLTTSGSVCNPEEERHSIIVSFGTGGQISPSGTKTVSNGADQTLTIIPDTGYRIFDVRVNGSSVGALTFYNFINIKNDNVIAAIFTEKTHILTAKAKKGGSIYPFGEININYGSNRTFSITPLPGHDLSDVKVDGSSIGAVNRYTFWDIKADHTVEAFFKDNETHINGQTSSIEFENSATKPMG